MYSKFLPATQNAKGVVYHCIPVAPRGDSIYPSARYGTDISPDVRNQLNISADEKAPLIFASPHINKAMAFALQGSLDEKIMNCSITGSDSELVIACDRAAMLSRQRDVTIYEVPAHGFVDLPYAERQCVATQAIPFRDTRVAFRAQSTQDLMRAGLQIISFTDSARQPDGSYPCLIEAMQKRGDSDIYPAVAEMLNSGKMAWENKAAGLSPDPVLAEKLCLPAARPAPARSPGAPRI